jgi:CRISPR/Cas system-associated protein Csx1
LYKVKDKVYLRKPKGVEDVVEFTADTESHAISYIKHFIEKIITDSTELVYIKNDIGFTLSEIYGENHSIDTTIPLYKGCIFYVWVYLPYESKSTTSYNVIFPYDLCYIRQALSETECKNFIALVKRDINAQIYVRKINQVPSLPGGLAGGIRPL